MVKHGDVHNLGLQSLKIMFQRPTDNKKLRVAHACVVVFGAVIYMFLIIMYIPEIKDVKGFARTIESFSSFCQGFIKQMPLLLQSERLGVLLEQMKYFWNPDDFSPEIVKEAERIYNISWFWQSVYRTAVFTTLAVFYFRPLFEEGLLLVCYIPDLPYMFEFLMVTQYIFGFWLCCFMTGYDNLYVSFCTHSCVQLMIVNRCIRQEDVSAPDYKEKLRVFVSHQRLILKYGKEMMVVFAISLLGQYVLSILLSCMEMYILTQSYKDPARVFLCICYLSSLMFQMGLFCFPATALSAEAEATADSTYFSNWYDSSISMQKNIAIMLMKSQSEFKIMAGGMAQINREAFTVIMKSSFSMFTLLRNLNDT